MMKKLSNIFYIIIGIAAVGFVGYTYFQGQAHKATVYIDNPTNQQITVQIDDGAEIVIEPQEYDTLKKLAAGEHTVKMNGEEIGKFTNEKGDAFALINPTKSWYMKDYVAYTSSSTVADEAFPETQTIDFYGIELDTYDASNNLYVNFNPTYALDEYFPDSITTRKSRVASLFSKDEEVRSKIYRAKDFILANYEISEAELDALIAEGIANTPSQEEAPETEEAPTEETPAQ